ncbi:MAG TPA: hypothetical protein VMX76_01875 [Nevskiaceae bacterium]|nr:hypothetical protein [Nevskiaceae bacterium]
MNKRIFRVFLFLIILFFTSARLAKADVYTPPKTSSCFEDEVFVEPWGKEMSADFFRINGFRERETHPKIEEAISCLRNKGKLSRYCSKVKSYFKKEDRGYCLSINDYCSLTGCSVEEKRKEIANLTFYTNSLFFNKKRTILSPVEKLLMTSGGTTGALKSIGINFGLNYLFFLLIFFIFQKAILDKNYWSKLGNVLRILLVTALGFFVDLLAPLTESFSKYSGFYYMPTVYEGWLKRLYEEGYYYFFNYIAYLVIFILVSVFAYFLLFKPIEFKKAKYKILAALLFGFLSNPIWMLLVK